MDKEEEGDLKEIKADLLKHTQMLLSYAESLHGTDSASVEAARSIVISFRSIEARVEQLHQMAYVFLREKMKERIGLKHKNEMESWCSICINDRDSSALLEKVYLIAHQCRWAKDEIGMEKFIEEIKDIPVKKVREILAAKHQNCRLMQDLCELFARVRL